MVAYWFDRDFWPKTLQSSAPKSVCFGPSILPRLGETTPPPARPHRCPLP
jgi:hypothetical protein